MTHTVTFATPLISTRSKNRSLPVNSQLGGKVVDIICAMVELASELDRLDNAAGSVVTVTGQHTITTCISAP